MSGFCRGVPPGQGDRCCISSPVKLARVGNLMALCFLPRFQRRRQDKVRQKKEEKAVERLEQELLRGGPS